MKQYIVTVTYKPKHFFDSGVLKVRIEAKDEDSARKKVEKSNFFPYDGTILRIREAKYYKK